jgi:hypothetical protein
MIKIVHAVSTELVKEIRATFFLKNLRRIVRFAEVFPEEKISHTLCSKLNWSHFRLIIYIHEDLKRDFYAEIVALIDGVKSMASR